MKVSTKRILSMIVSLALLIGTIVIYAGFMKPELTAITTIRGEIKTKQDQSTTQQGIVAKAKEAIKKYQNSAGLKDTISLALPVGEGVPAALAQIQAIVKNSGASLNAISFKVGALEKSTKVLVKRMGTLDVECEVIGSYASVKEFVRMIEANVRVANTVKISVGNGQSGTLKLGDTERVAMSFQMFYQEK